MLNKFNGTRYETEARDKLLPIGVAPTEEGRRAYMRDVATEKASGNAGMALVAAFRMARA